MKITYGKDNVTIVVHEGTVQIVQNGTVGGLRGSTVLILHNRMQVQHIITGLEDARDACWKQEFIKWLTVARGWEIRRKDSFENFAWCESEKDADFILAALNQDK